MPTRNSRLLVTKAKHNGGTKAIKGKITRRVQHEYIRPERKKKLSVYNTCYMYNNGVFYLLLESAKGQLISKGYFSFDKSTNKISPLKKKLKVLYYEPPN